jgi:hypothetical protein
MNGNDEGPLLFGFLHSTIPGRRGMVPFVCIFFALRRSAPGAGLLAAIILPVAPLGAAVAKTSPR